MTYTRTDRDRIEQAFEVLRAKGYDCRPAAACCRTCALAEIPGDKWVFWTEQGDESAFGEKHDPDEDCDGVDDQSLNLLDDLYLYWGGSGREIVQALEKAGLTVEWKGSDAYGICLKKS